MHHHTMLNFLNFFSNEKQKVGYLPEEHHFSHELSFFLHDILVQIIKSGEEAGIFADSRHTINNPEHVNAILPLSGEELWEWLEQNGYQHIVDDIILKQATVALLSDFCHFVYEALSCSKKQKLTVTFALLRKPLKDNLFYFEWLVVDRGEFLKSFKNGLVEPTPEIRENVIRRAVELIPNSGLFNAGLIYDFRYKKSANFGFEGNWNKANHLITTCKSFRTEVQNFNFVFSGTNEHESHWRFLYSRLPYLLNYAVEVVELLLECVARTDPAYVETMRLRRMAGLLMWTQKLDSSVCGWKHDAFAKQLRNCLKISCPKCGKTYCPEVSQLLALYEAGKTVCPLCGKGAILPLLSRRS